MGRRQRRWARTAALVMLSVPVVSGAQTWTAPGPTDKVENGVNWTWHVIQAKAIGVPPPNAASAEQGRALAITAATVLARQELLAIARGVTINARTTVQAAMVASAVTEARVVGVVRGSRVVDVRDLGGGGVEVTVAIPATGEFADVLLPPAPPRPMTPAPVSIPAPGPPQASPPPAAPPASSAPPTPSRPLALLPSEVYIGLVVDARGLGVKPAMAPKIISEAGQEVYGFSVVDRNWVIQQGMAGYSKSLRAAQAHERVADSPLTIKAVAVARANMTDVVISNADAQLLVGAGQHLAFLEKARVMMVVD